ncbi:WD repeat protein [Corchorus olitorius]|uniref:WD repeat protein n=1 Tax=Corchorus olitorius TaxID=93759 RepID=A0A1R3JJH6_9ROSI|nr:WD repeat protein [Corchorus olitorius]
MSCTACGVVFQLIAEAAEAPAMDDSHAMIWDLCSMGMLFFLSPANILASSEFEKLRWPVLEGNSDDRFLRFR